LTPFFKLFEPPTLVDLEREIATHKLRAVIKNFQQFKKTLTIVPLLHMFNANRVVVAVVASVKLAKVPATDAEYIDCRRSRTVQPQPNLSPTPSIHHHEPSFFTAGHHAAKSVS